jgi:hypothetical protein
VLLNAYSCASIKSCYQIIYSSLRFGLSLSSELTLETPLADSLKPLLKLNHILLTLHLNSLLFSGYLGLLTCTGGDRWCRLVEM